MDERRYRWWVIAAALWSVGEATVFFVVPDVLLTAAVLRYGPRKAWRLSALAACAAMAAGAGMWAWGAADGEGAQAVMLAVPAVGPDLLARVAQEMNAWWPVHVLAGAVSGVPYKLYAVEAGRRGIALLPFLAVSFGARLARFSLSVAIVAAGAAALDRIGAPRAKAALLVLGWFAIYAVYFAIRAAA